MQVFIVKRGVYEEETCLGVFADDALARIEVAKQIPAQPHPMFMVQDDAAFTLKWEPVLRPNAPSIAMWSERDGGGEWLSIETWDVRGAP